MSRNFLGSTRMKLEAKRNLIRKEGVEEKHKDGLIKGLQVVHSGYYIRPKAEKRNKKISGSINYKVFYMSVRILSWRR